MTGVKAINKPNIISVFPEHGSKIQQAEGLGPKVVSGKVIYPGVN